MQNLSLAHLLQERVQTEEDCVLFERIKYGTDANESLSLFQLDSAARKIAMQLDMYGVSGGQVMLLYPPGLDFIKALYGCLYAGVVGVPLHPGRGQLHGQGEVLSIVRQTKCKAILTLDSHKTKVESALGEGLKALHCGVLSTDTMEYSSQWQLPALDVDDVAYMQFTSGSSGAPKGVLISHRNILSNIGGIEQRSSTHPLKDKPSLCWLPMNHDLGLVGHVLWHVVYGTVAQQLMAPLAFLVNPIRWLENISRHKIAMTGGPTFAYGLCCQRIDETAKANLDLSCWKVAYVGAEPIRQEVLQTFAEQFSDCGFDPDAFQAGYGMAESTLVIASVERRVGVSTISVDPQSLANNRLELVTDGGQKLVSCGKPFDGHEIVIVEPQSRQLLEEANIGEIWVRGPSVSKGYWEANELTEATFGQTLPELGNGFLRTGDLGALYQGNLYVTGRLKDVVIIRGRNFAADHIESIVVRADPMLSNCLVAAIGIAKIDAEHLVIVAELPVQISIDEGAELVSRGELVEKVRRDVLDILGIEVQEVLFVAAGKLPRTTSGKVQRSAIKQSYLNKSLPTIKNV